MRVSARGSVAGLARKIPLHFVRRDFGRVFHSFEKPTPVSPAGRESYVVPTPVSPA